MTDHKKKNGELDHLLRQIIASISWWDQMMAVRALGRAATHQDHIAVALAMRDGGALSEDKAFFYVAVWIMRVAEERICDPHRPGLHPELEPIRADMEAIEEEHGLTKGDSWSPGEGPAEYQKLSATFDRVCDRITADTFKAYGETDMAALYLNDHDAFDRRYERGAAEFRGRPSQPTGD